MGVIISRVLLQARLPFCFCTSPTEMLILTSGGKKKARLSQIFAWIILVRNTFSRAVGEALCPALLQTSVLPIAYPGQRFWS